jgi:hypothetical protein
MSDARQLWAQLLRLDEPWTVTRCETHRSLRRYDLWIGLEEARGWFSLGRRPPRPTESRSWRHMNFGDWQLHLHVTLPQGADLSRLGWAGEPDLPFTRALSQHIFGLLKAGCSFQAVGELLDVPPGRRLALPLLPRSRPLERRRSTAGGSRRGAGRGRAGRR